MDIPNCFLSAVRFVDQPCCRFHEQTVAFAAIPVLGVVPAALGVLISLVRGAVALVLCVLANVCIIIGKAINPRAENFLNLSLVEEHARAVVISSSILLLRAGLSLISLGGLGWVWEKIHSEFSYGTVNGFHNLVIPFSGCSTRGSDLIRFC